MSKTKCDSFLLSACDPGDVRCAEVLPRCVQMWTSEFEKSVKLSQMKLAFCVSDHVAERNKTRNGLGAFRDKIGVNKCSYEILKMLTMQLTIPV